MIHLETKETGFDDTKLVADNMRAFGADTHKSHPIFPPACCLSLRLGSHSALLLASPRILNNGRAVTNSAPYSDCQSDSSRGKGQSGAGGAGANNKDI